jgi:hypothetical protein
MGSMPLKEVWNPRPLPSSLFCFLAMRWDVFALPQSHHDVLPCNRLRITRLVICGWSLQNCEPKSIISLYKLIILDILLTVNTLGQIYEFQTYFKKRKILRDKE